MSDSLPNLLHALKDDPTSVEFDQVMLVIAETYHYTPTRFTNGISPNQMINDAGNNEGSCKIFAFAKLQNLTTAQTLACFGKYYREDVLLHPEANDHSNIRNFMATGWAGIQFDGQALVEK